MPTIAKYIPLLKTTDAELKGYEKLSAQAKDAMLPLFELTKARRTKKDTYGDISKRMDRLSEITGGRKFILDLTSHDDLSNYQIEDLLTPYSGFSNWVDFLSRYKNLSIIPAIHIDPSNLNETKALAKKLAAYPLLALRVESFDQDIRKYLQEINTALNGLEKLILIIDHEFIKPDQLPEKIQAGINQLDSILNSLRPGSTAIASSGFPKSVQGHTKTCEYHGGWFEKTELALFEGIKNSTQHEIIYSDYGSVHPVRYNGAMSTWVPRVDFSLWGKYIYTRYRRNDGGYSAAARDMLQHPEYSRLNSCWGCDEIEHAATEHPNGLSPAHWISVRVNIHLTRHALNIKG